MWDTHCRQRYPCTTCARGDFTSERSMKKHEEGCDGQAPEEVFCYRCKVLFVNPRELQIHVHGCVPT
jgi:hypothetical protein